MRLKQEYLDAGPDTQADTKDPKHATIFSDSTHDGLGSWGDSDNDYQISTGGLKDVMLTYPAPHHIRRNYTLQPFLTPANGFTPPAGVDPAFMINTTYTQDAVDVALDNYTGNYTGFQAYFENIFGPHPGPHIILGGDMSGTCPNGLQPPDCIGGQKWSPNGTDGSCLDRMRVLIRSPPHFTDPLFFLHHAVRFYNQFHQGYGVNAHVFQMVDRVWYEWQKEDSKNKNAFEGGSVSVQVDPTVPITGGPPMLSVRGNSLQLP